MATEIRASCERELDVRGQLLDQVLADLAADLDALDDPFMRELQNSQSNIEFLRERRLAKMDRHLRRVKIGLIVMVVGFLLQVIAEIVKLVGR